MIEDIIIENAIFSSLIASFFIWAPLYCATGLFWECFCNKNKKSVKIYETGLKHSALGFVSVVLITAVILMIIIFK